MEPFLMDYTDKKSGTDLKTLKKYKEGIEAKKTVYETLGGEYKKTMESLLSEISAKVAKMEKEQ